MHIEAVKTRLMMPPQDDLYALLEESITALPEASILVVTSKIVAIHQGRCVHRDSPILSEEEIRQESDYYMLPHIPTKWMTIRDSVLMPFAGYDGLGHEWWVLAPLDLKAAAREIHQRLVARFHVHRLGVIISDSIIWPMRRGAVGVSLASAGFCPVHSYQGKQDLLGRDYRYFHVNHVDGLAASAVFVMGESDELTPLALITEVPHVVFGDCPEGTPALEIPPDRDPYAPMLTHRAWKRGALAPPRESLWTRLYRWLTGFVWRWRQRRKG